MSLKIASPTARKIARILHNANMQNAKVSCYEIDSTDDVICYEFSSSLSYDNDSRIERDWSIGIDY